MKDKINFFKKNGFVILRNIVEKNQLKNLLKEVEIIKTKVIKTK